MARTKRTGKHRARAKQPFLTDRRTRHVGLVLAGLLALGVFAASTGALAFLWYANSQIRHIPATELPDIDPAPQEPLDPINVLILGSDSREALTEKERIAKGGPEDVEGERSDTIILGRFDPQGGQAVLLHFPRDLYVEIPGHGMDRINAAFTLGGPNLTIKTVKQLTHIPIHHYVEVNFKGFRRMVRALDGVEICIDQPMIDPHADLNLPRAGCYELSGREALAFVRARDVQGDEIPDFSRIARQQQFIRAVMNKAFSLGSVARLPRLVRVAARSVVTDRDIDITELLDYGRELQRLAQVEPSGGSTVDLRVVPAVPQDVDGNAVVVALPEAERLFRRFKEGRPLGRLGLSSVLTPISPAQISTRVLQAGSPAAATRVEDLLRDAGFIVLPRERVEEQAESEILFARGERDQARVVEGYFPELPARRGGARLLGEAHVAIVVGADRARSGQ